MMDMGCREGKGGRKSRGTKDGGTTSSGLLRGLYLAQLAQPRTHYSRFYAYPLPVVENLSHLNQLPPSLVKHHTRSIAVSSSTASCSMDSLFKCLI